jgi:cytochrome b
MQRVKIWDSFVRISHWLMVLLVVAMWFTAEEGYMEWHLRLAAVLGALVITRILWGFFGSDSARFSKFLKGPAAVVSHVREFRQGHYQPSNTHNAAGGWAAVLLLLLVALQFTSGLFATDEIFHSGPLASLVSSGFSEAATEFHETVFNVLVALVVVHVVAIILYRIKGINLIAAMLHGYRENVAAPRLVSGIIGIIAAAVIAAALFAWIN